MCLLGSWLLLQEQQLSGKITKAQVTCDRGDDWCVVFVAEAGNFLRFADGCLSVLTSKLLAAVASFLFPTSQLPVAVEAAYCNKQQTISSSRTTADSRSLRVKVNLHEDDSHIFKPGWKHEGTAWCHISRWARLRFWFFLQNYYEQIFFLFGKTQNSLIEVSWFDGWSSSSCVHQPEWHQWTCEDVSMVGYTLMSRWTPQGP